MVHLEFSLYGFLSAFFRQFFIFFSLIILCMAAGIYYISKTPDIYETRASFVVKFGDDAKPDISLVENYRPREYSYSDRTELIESYIRIMQSRDVLRNAVADIGVFNLYPSLRNSHMRESHATETAIDRLISRDLRAESALRSNIIEIYVQNENPEIAARFADKLMEHFIPKQIQIYTSPQQTFLEEQIKEIETRHEIAQIAFLRFKQSAGITAIDQELEQLLSEKSELSTIAFQAMTQAQAKVVELEAQTAQARATYRPQSQMMQRLNKSLGVARANLESRQNDLNQTQNGQGGLSDKLSALNKRIAHLEAQRGRFNELQQQVDMEARNLEYYKRRIEEARINEALRAENITRIRVLDKAVPPSTPVGPKRPFIFLASLLAGLILGGAAAGTRELLDEKFSTADQLEDAMGLPVLMTFNKGIK